MKKSLEKAKPLVLVLKQRSLHGRLIDKHVGPFWDLERANEFGNEQLEKEQKVIAVNKSPVTRLKTERFEVHELFESLEEEFHAE